MGEQGLGHLRVCKGRESGERGGHREGVGVVKELRISAIFSSKNTAKED